MDGYVGYNQICLVEKDQEKMAFTTTHNLYYFTVMPSGLKNAGAAY